MRFTQQKKPNSVCNLRLEIFILFDVEPAVLMRTLEECGGGDNIKKPFLGGDRSFIRNMLQTCGQKIQLAYCEST